MKAIPAELNAIAGQLQTYRAPEEIIQHDIDYQMTYEILQWKGTLPNGLTEDLPIGSVEISRYNKENGTEYRIVEKRDGGGQEIYEAKVATVPNESIGESIQNWQLNWYQAETPDKRMHINGTVHTDAIEINGTTGKRRISENVPVSCQWILPFTLANRTAQIDDTFTTVDELTYIKTGQHLRGPAQIQANSESFLSFLHTGQGTLPIHYVLDSQGRPVFVTFTLVSWILRDIDIF